MEKVKSAFLDRKTEIIAYLELIDAIDSGLQSGTLHIKAGDQDHKIQPLHQKVLYASLYLHLYNLVESTVTLLVEAIESAAQGTSNAGAGRLSSLVRRQWVKAAASTTDAYIGAETRLERALEMCDQILGLIPFNMEISKGGGGNWDDSEIESLAKRLGVNLSVEPALKKKVKRPMRDKNGPLKLIRVLRNKLAHGEISFSECGAEYVASDLRYIAETTIEYLTTIMQAFELYVDGCEYLDESLRADQIIANAAKSTVRLPLPA